MSERIGWIGLGALGAPLASNLLEQGYKLSVFNRTRDKAQALVSQGACLADHPVDVLTAGGVVVSVLWNSEITEAIVTEQFLSRIEGGVHIGMCTGTPEAAKRLAELHQTHGSSYVEAPVFGRPEAAKTRTLMIPFAGPPEATNRISPLLTAMGAATLFNLAEKIGNPTVLKQLGNFLIISAGLSLREGLSIAESQGADVAATVEMLTATLFPSPIYRNYGKHFLKRRTSWGNLPFQQKTLSFSTNWPNRTSFQIQSRSSCYSSQQLTADD